jgi:RNA polymerase sigma factor (sigma-70 family)
MALEIEEIKLEIEKTLKSLSDREGDEFAVRLGLILSTNLKRGRIQVFVEEDIKRVPEYVWKVAENYKNLGPLINQLQIERSAKTWESVFLKMQTWAYNFFIRKNFYPNIATQESAVECATEAAISVLSAHFPYDTEFEPWAHMIVLHACQKYIRKGMLSGKYQANIGILDEEAENIQDHAFQEFEYHKSLRNDLLNALSQLPLSRRQVIEMMYFRGFSAAEIAAELGKSVGAVYSQHFNALSDLKKVMGQTRDNINE